MRRCPICHAPKDRDHLTCPGCGYRQNRHALNRRQTGGSKPEPTGIRPPGIEIRTANFG